MKAFYSKTCSIVALFFALTGLAQASVIGNLNDGLDHTASTTGYWSLYVNAGDFVTVTARRLDPVDIIAVALNGPDGSGTQVGSGDDQLPPFAGGPFGDPQFSFTALTTGEYSVGVFRFGSNNAIEQIDYFVNARGATGSQDGVVPEPGTFVLMALGLAGLAFRNRKSRGA